MSNRVRIYDLAKQLGMSSKDAVEMLQELGVPVKSHSSTIDEAEAEALREMVEAEQGSGTRVQERQEEEEPAGLELEEGTLEAEVEVLEEEMLGEVEETLGDQRRGDGRRRRGRVERDGRAREEQPQAEGEPEEAEEEEKEEGEEAVAEAPDSTLIEIEGELSIRDLAALLEVPPADILVTLMATGAITSMNQPIDVELAAIVAEQYGKRVVLKQPEEEEEPEAPVEEKTGRTGPEVVAPIVTILGHVDHGKTTLLDTIRRTKVAEQEEGGITQHVGAYEVEWKGHTITFIDTPGHEAFTSMRARGAQVTDIAVLVVAADDGVMPQTLEALRHARAASVPIVVAINKVDLEDADPERVKQQLAENNLLPEEWGGDTIVVPLSAKTGQGVDDLLEMILLVAEMEDVRGDPKTVAHGVVVESFLDRGRGSTATVLVLNGTLRAGDTIIAGSAYGRIRQMLDHLGRPVKQAPPSKPVQVIGLSEVPEVGTTVEVARDERAARRLLQERQAEAQGALQEEAPPSLADLLQQAQEGEKKALLLVVKSDVLGSAEAIEQSVAKLSGDEVEIEILHAGVGNISKSDIMLAEASGAMVIGFRVSLSGSDRKLADEMNVQVRQYGVIYDLLEDVRALVTGMLEPRFEEEILGHAEVLQVFRAAQFGQVAGCRVVDGRLTHRERVRIARQGHMLFEGHIDSLRRVRESVREVPAGQECGVGVSSFNDFQPGDILECYTMREVQRQL